MVAADTMILMPVSGEREHGHGCHLRPHHHFKLHHRSHPLVLPPHGSHPHHCLTSSGPPRFFGRHHTGHHGHHGHHHYGHFILNGHVGMVPPSSSEQEHCLHPDTGNYDSGPSQGPAITEMNFLDFVPHRHSGHKKRHGGHHKVKRCHHFGHLKRHVGMRRCAPPPDRCCHSGERGSSATTSAPINDVENLVPVTAEGVEEANEALAVMALNETNNNNKDNINPSS